MVEDRAPQATLPMTRHSRGLVVTFRPRPPGAHPIPRGPAATAKNCLVRLCERRDVVLNANWDRFIALVLEAWCWRDPDCMAAVVDCITLLRRSVDNDWS